MIVEKSMGAVMTAARMRSSFTVEKNKLEISLGSSGIDSTGIESTPS